MKWVFYVIVFVYMFYKAVYGVKLLEKGLTVEPVTYDNDPNGFLTVGDHKTISCRASNKNQKVEWIDPKGNTVKRIPTERVFSQQHFVQSLKGRSPALVLTITSANVHDTGIYQCRSGDLVKNVSLCVIDPSEFINTSVEVTADLGRSITLSCQAKGEPEPRLLWSRNGQTITDEDSTEKYKVMTKYNIQGFEGLLTITSLEPDDSGIYSCMSLQENIQVDDCSHVKILNITVNVRYAPVFEDDKLTENVYGRINQTVDIECSASGYPTPTYRWFEEINDGLLVKYDKNQVSLDEDENRAVLTVFANQSTYGQTFKCAATNELGTSSKLFTLMQMVKPRRPSEVNLYNATVDAVQLNVTWYDEILFPVTDIEVQYMRDQGERRSIPSNWKRSQSIEVEIEDLDPEEGGLIFTLPGLEQDTSYWLRLRARNSAGDSTWSDSTFVSTSAEEEEAPVVEEVEAEAKPEENGEPTSSTTFYGIFFAGGVLVVAAICMFAMRMVK